ncbi:hypothetical protein [Clostridium estertheticum]|uniref:hypothetical protein n=1 Tax=Clostridium estertheticum TaxID=238834 RepID=UPI001C6F4B64|nr:hypothetical protein [Clostridium estertheticum]MBW9154246.1 hypothetical protein [Clostridium estertheticum]WLC86675.1 hypothetical protein KTC97_21875 [Clostridium estertheticum]
MNKIKLEKILRNYKTIKSIIDTTNARIQAYREAINNPELISSWGFSNGNRELGMPGAPLRNTSSPVEREICDNELTVEIIEDWIKEDKSRIYRKKLQAGIIENSLEALTIQERYIIKMKYFEKMNWNNIELNFNNEFKQKNDITSERIKKINAQSIISLLKIFIPLENTFN